VGRHATGVDGAHRRIDRVGPRHGEDAFPHERDDPGAAHDKRADHPADHAPHDDETADDHRADDRSDPDHHDPDDNPDRDPPHDDASDHDSAADYRPYGDGESVVDNVDDTVDGDCVVGPVTVDVAGA
jgi:hypothetical protein